MSVGCLARSGGMEYGLTGGGPVGGLTLPAGGLVHSEYGGVGYGLAGEAGTKCPRL